MEAAGADPELQPEVPSIRWLIRGQPEQCQAIPEDTEAEIRAGEPGWLMAGFAVSHPFPEDPVCDPGQHQAPPTRSASR